MLELVAVVATGASVTVCNNAAHERAEVQRKAFGWRHLSSSTAGADIIPEVVGAVSVKLFAIGPQGGVRSACLPIAPPRECNTKLVKYKAEYAAFGAVRNEFARRAWCVEHFTRRSTSKA